MRFEIYPTKHPCRKDCPDRTPTCHSHCEAYLAWREQNTARVERDGQIRRRGDMADNVLAEGRQKMIRRARRK